MQSQRLERTLRGVKGGTTMTDIINLYDPIPAYPVVTSKYWKGWEKERKIGIQKKLTLYEEELR